MITSLTVLAAAFTSRSEPCRRTRITGIDTLIAEPCGGSDRVVVFANAATPRGIDEPAVGRLLGGLASAGFVAIAPELPHVRRGEVTAATVDTLVAVAGAAQGPVILLGASTGAGLAILAAADPRLAPRVCAVMSIAPFASLRELLRVATTGHYRNTRFDAVPLVATATARSLLASAPSDPAVPALLANRDPQRFDALFADLAPATRALVEELSPVARIGDVRAPIEILSSPHDPFFPAEEAHMLATAGRTVRLTETQALEHVRPRLRPGLVRVATALHRTLRPASTDDRRPLLAPSPAA
ncbi:MAG TPA: hypothetical protein VFV56_09325 [Gaiellaceae bacterium]|nr:hypothetical protein [Gaiellaceae bacterium]